MKQTRLESTAIELRNDRPYIQRDYLKGEGLEYSEQHKDARSDGDPQGKGTGVSLGYAPQPGSTTSRAISKTNVDTMNGGGLYDIDGRNGIGGRNRSKLMNLYSSENEYGDIDTSANVLEGQYVVK